MSTPRIPFLHLTRLARVQNTIPTLRPKHLTRLPRQHQPCQRFSAPAHKLQPAVDSHQRFRRGIAVAAGALTLVVAWYYARQRPAYSQQANGDPLGLFSSLVHRRSIKSDSESTYDTDLQEFLEDLKDGDAGSVLADGKVGRKRKKGRRKAGVGKEEETNALLSAMQAFFNDLRGEVVGVTFKDGEIRVKRGHVKPKGKNKHHTSSLKHEPHLPILPLPARTFTRTDVSHHTTKQTGIWIIHNNGVYDITSFVDIHPGGERIFMAAGKSIDPFWSVFTIHHSPETYDILEQYRIGDLTPDDDPALAEEMHKKEVEALGQLFANDPKRDPSLIVRSAQPCNAETPKPELSAHFVTPNYKFYVRNHLPVPHVDEEDFALEVEGPGITDGFRLSLEDLKSRFRRTDVMVTMQCAGNRRKDMKDQQPKPVKGLGWEEGAIGNAVWGGVLLRDILASAGYPVNDLGRMAEDGVEHVVFDAMDGYGASIPARTAMDPLREVLVAYEMNGEPLPPDHGAPLRVVVGGTVAARSVKWVNKITLSEEESYSHWQRKDYKGFSPSATQETSDYEKAESIQDTPVQSAILEVNPEDGKLHLKGYAYSGAGRAIIRVDVSADGGKTWSDAELHHPPQEHHKQWAWTQWETTLAVPKDVAATEVVCKAVDADYNTQPESISTVYNVRGVLNTAWHRVRMHFGGDGKEEV
ncbi:hypothetical protein HDV00_008370 [Rhizophlyctis rosea]|nr:hypothetical protein HDV00_008370 [Rhizophlyctis rosea]